MKSFLLLTTLVLGLTTVYAGILPETKTVSAFAFHPLEHYVKRYECVASVFEEVFLRHGLEAIWSECGSEITKAIEKLKQTKYDETVNINDSEEVINISELFMESGMDLSWNIQDDILDSQDHCFTPEQVAERNASNGPKFYLADSDEDSSSSETSSDDDSD